VRAVPVAVPLDLLEVFDGYDTVVVVDATRSGTAPGTVTVTEGPLASQGSASTHGLGLAEAVELARALDRLPWRLVVVGVEVGSTEPGTPLSPAVAGAVEAAVAQVRACLAVSHGGA
jgi:hydrogenase maturation protease